MAVEADGRAQVPAGALEAAADDVMRTNEDKFRDTLSIYSMMKDFLIIIIIIRVIILAS